MALSILSEAGDLRQFKHCRQFVKFCGFDLSTEQSGHYRGHSRLSKRGNARLRKSFWIAATIAIRMRENTFRKKFENYSAARYYMGDDCIQLWFLGVLQAENSG